jgi:3-phosphoshikimate 1-carboxyvinyltransferase
MGDTEIISRSPVIIRMPGAKSITHRAIIAACLARGGSLLRDFLNCEDTQFTLQALKRLGAHIRIKEQYMEIAGLDGPMWKNAGTRTFNVGNSGTSFRLLMSIMALGKGEFLLTGNGRMLERPVEPLVKALNHMGAHISHAGNYGYPPVRISAAGICGGKCQIEGDQSSQFISSILLSGPYAEKDVEVEIIGELVSRPYVDITIEVMESFGVRVHRDEYKRFQVPSGQRYQGRELVVRGDASSASYFWAGAAVTGSTVVTENIYPFSTCQGDMRFLEVLEQMGCTIEREPDRVIVNGGRLSGIDVEMSAMPDMVPTLAAVALFADGDTTIRNVHHLRFKESDRLRAIALEWGRLGGHVAETDDGLIIHGGRNVTGNMVNPHNDHRLAMSLAVIGLRVPGIRIKDKSCVNKSFPTFWRLWDLCFPKSMSSL